MRVDIITTTLPYNTEMITTRRDELITTTTAAIPQLEMITTITSTPTTTTTTTTELTTTTSVTTTTTTTVPTSTDNLDSIQSSTTLKIKPNIIKNKNDEKKKSKKNDLFIIFHKKFISIYKRLDIQYIILLIILISLICTTIFITCIYVLCKIICKRKPRKVKIRKDNYHSNSLKLEMKTSNNQHSITLNTYSPMITSSTNSTCTYAS